MSDFRKTAGLYYQMTRPRIVFMVVVMATWGYFLATRHGDGAPFDLVTYLAAMVGTALAAAGGTVLNHYLERDLDARMERTRERPLASGALLPASALALGLCLILAGVSLTVTRVNLLAGFLVLMSDFLYVLVYTPMKRVSPVNTTIGAIPGALPPLIGWAAARGTLDAGGWMLFTILFVWQHPHVFAIGWMYRDDYIRAGFRMLSVNDDGSKTVRAVIVGTLVLVAVSAGPVILGLSGLTYALSAGVMGALLMAVGLRMRKSLSIESARAVMKATVFYLPLLLLVTIIDALIRT